MSIFSLPSPIQRLESTFLMRNKVEVFVKRDDLIHPIVSGNKWRKLKYNLEQAKAKKKACILTFGGAYSNHLTATSEVGRLLNFKTIGIIRGEEPKELSNTLLNCRQAGMNLHFISREKYRLKENVEFVEGLKEKFGDLYIIPEGGANELGVKGCEEIFKETSREYDYVSCAAGTATTAAGILRTLTNEQLIVVPVLMNGGFLKNKIRNYTDEKQMNKLILLDQYHFGGYAKVDQRLIDFANQFYMTYHIPLDLVYTAKLFYAIFQIIEQGYFSANTKILLIHTGGLQGNEGLEKRYGFRLEYC